MGHASLIRSASAKSETVSLLLVINVTLSPASER
jgi:hypothetical protein